MCLYFKLLNINTQVRTFQITSIIHEISSFYKKNTSIFQHNLLNRLFLCNTNIQELNSFLVPLEFLDTCKQVFYNKHERNLVFI